MLQLDGRVPLLGQHLCLLQQALVLLLQLLQAAQVRAVDGALSAGWKFVFSLNCGVCSLWVGLDHWLIKFP